MKTRALMALGAASHAGKSHTAAPFLRSETFGYVMSAMFGVGLIILTALLIGRILRRGRNTDAG